MIAIDKGFDEYTVGEKIGRSPGRTITETDVVMFCMFTGNWAQIHSNIEFARKAHFGQRLVQGSLVFAVMAGLVHLGPTISAGYGFDKVRFLKPVFFGDTIYLEPEVLRLKAKDEKHGVGTFLMRAVNQRDELVQSNEFSVLLLRKRSDVPKD
jgi:acyl dehydratase